MNSESSNGRQSAVRIEFQGDIKEAFHPGDKVAGKVVFEPPFDQRVSSVTVELSGICDTHSPLIPGFCPRLLYTTCHICLFRLEQHLDVGDERAWPFEIEFPQWTDPSDKDLPPNSYSLASGALALPPSFSAEKPPGFVVGSVKYFLSAAVASELDEGRSPFQHRASHQILVDLPKAHPDEFLPARLPPFKGRAIGRRSFDWRFESPSSARKLRRACTIGWLKPRLKIQPIVEFPSAFVRGKESSITLMLESDSKTTDLATIPGQKLEDLKIVLESHTDVAAYKMGWRQRIQINKIVHERSMAMPILQGMVHLKVNIPEPSVPDFVTYTLQHTHKLKVTGFIRVGRKRFPFKFTQPMKIVTMPEHPYLCPAHGMSYSTNFLPTHCVPSFVHTPGTAVTTPDSGGSSFCITCRTEEANKAARALMVTIPEASQTDMRSMDMSPSPPARREMSSEQEPVAASEGDNNNGDRHDSGSGSLDSADHAHRLHEKRDSVDTDRLGPAAERRDSAYVSAVGTEKDGGGGGGSGERTEAMVDGEKLQLQLDEKTPATAATHNSNGSSNDTQIRTTATREAAAA
ncbi:hypothetical protein IWZ01DRAFT_549058 [Phyllosticta capitalensis]